MVKKALLLLAAAASFAGAVQAQQHVHSARCYTDDKHAELKEKFPKIAIKEAELKAQMIAQLNNMDLQQFKTTAESGIHDTERLYIPVVFHIVHDYGDEYIIDNDVYLAMKQINELFNNTTADTAGIIPPFSGNIRGTNVKYAGNARITFKLATKDPLGNPTHGITRRRSYLTGAAGDQAKYESWPSNRYMNIWIIRAFNEDHEDAAAYAYKPVTASFLPFLEGVIGKQQFDNGGLNRLYINYDNTLAHELAHTLNLDHPWGATNKPNVACGDDEVDDTPPTMGHENCSPAALYDHRCVLTDTVIGKTTINVATDIADNLNEGITFITREKTNIDFVSFYPVDSGAAYQIVLRKTDTTGLTTTIGTYSGVTTNNKRTTATVGKPLTNAVTVAPLDSLEGEGISFKVYDSLIIRSVMFVTNPASVGEPYQIDLLRNGSVISSFSSAVTTANQIAPVNFNIPYVDANATYEMRFALNPGARRTEASAAPGEKTIANIITIVDDTTRRDTSTNVYLYNYFYEWKLTTFDYAEVAPVRFLAPASDTDTYKLEFTVNPGAKRDPGAAANDSSLGVVFVEDVTGGYYNYFYNWQTRYGDYYKIYSPAQAWELFGITSATPVRIDYPDTSNTQNSMDYSYCSKMFTHGQVLRMRQTLRSSVANRDTLVSPFTAQLTGIHQPWPDLPPVADFSVDRLPPVTGDERVFVCANATNAPVSFRNRSWNDTVSSVSWTFSNNATTPTRTSQGNAIDLPVSNTFGTPGWVTVSLVANSDAGSDTITRTNSVYVADPTTMPAGYIGEFDAAGDRDKYPIFNYFENTHKWEYVNTGTYDNSGIRYNNFDKRRFMPLGIDAYIGTPLGDYDDYFTPAFNPAELGTGGNTFLNFFSSGASRSSDPALMNDELEIAYSVTCGQSWSVLTTLTGTDLANRGTPNPDLEFMPAGPWEWVGKSLALPNVVKTANRVFFRFRYKPGTNESEFGTGNHFYMDRIHLGKWTTSVSTPEFNENGFVLAPNPTTGSTSVIIKESKSKSARIIVTDITGKTVYATEAALSSIINRIEIPANAIAVKGMYLVSVVTDNAKHTEKLVVH